ncbi:unnamed protein product [Mesocestoides corti]|uniref:Acyltransferase C-terminal domain-containing protein n=1 Tax=Mesocestoides corti TaxID=53468 RepID=A0A0R3UNZ3_MESCO|nr:unnamed protein product [Mesocestoides corti]
MIIARQGGIGRLRFILLNALKYIPVFGYYFYQSWIVAFPEVDRFSPAKPKVIEESRAFAVSKNLTPLQYHLTPRVRGIELLLNNMYSHLNAVYDMTVVFGDENGSCLDKTKPMPGLFSYLMKPHTLHIHLQRCPVADVPQEHDALRAWLSSRFALKDNIGIKLLATQSVAVMQPSLFADLDQVKKEQSRQPNVSEVKAAFLKNLSNLMPPLDDHGESAQPSVEELIATGKRSLLCLEFASAVQCFQRACQILAEANGDLHDTLAVPNLLYGTALLELSRCETKILSESLEKVHSPEGTPRMCYIIFYREICRKQC